MAMTATDRRVQAAEAYVQAMRTGAPSATQRAAQFLADDVTLVTGNQEVNGKQAVTARITGQWPFTPVYEKGAWSEPKLQGDQAVVTAEFPGMGAAPGKTTFTFSFNGSGQISRVQQQVAPGNPPQSSNEMPDLVRGMLNSALANGTPIVVAYTGEDGQPQLSLRGSTLVYSPNQLAIWVRNAEGGIIKAMDRNPRISFLYRDSKSRSTIIIQGHGHVATDEETRNRVFDLSPEVEQNHDPARKGAALIIDIDRMQAGTPNGMYRMPGA